MDQCEYQRFSTIFHDPTTQVTETFDRASLSSKVPKPKTRGSAAPRDGMVPGIPHGSSEVTALLGIDRRAHKVFLTLSHSPNTNPLGRLPPLDGVSGLLRREGARFSMECRQTMGTRLPALDMVVIGTMRDTTWK